ncbi:MAG: NifU family protein [bacterium]|nr:NifU family protein [bacterium]
MHEDVEKILDEIRPSLQADGGDVELVELKDGVVKVHLIGACNGCPMASITLKMGVEKLLTEKMKGFKELRAV